MAKPSRLLARRPPGAGVTMTTMIEAARILS